MTDLKVTQADRDAAAVLMPVNTIAEWERVADTKSGRNDGDYRVQAFARHRIAAEEGKAELVEALEDVLDSVGALSNLSEFPNCFGITEDRGREILAALARVRGEG